MPPPDSSIGSTKRSPEEKQKTGVHFFRDDYKFERVWNTPEKYIEKLAEYLALHHKGEANAVTSRELECSFQMRGSELRREINALGGDGIPICSFEGGYYYAATAEELERTIRQLRSRIKKIAFAERGLSSALPDYADTGQLSLPLDGGDAP